MAASSVADWLDERAEKESVQYVKRLSGNDTLANEAHQAGPYIPRNILLELLPDMNRPDELNPRADIDVHVDSHADRRRVQVIWYNNKLHGGTRNETRLTGFGGAGSALLDPDSTGALTVFAFSASGGGPIDTCNIWVCRDAGEEDIVEERVGAIDPGHGVVWPPRHRVFSERLWRDFVSPGSCWLKPDEIPDEWAVRFPSGADIVAKAVEMRPESTEEPDKRLLRRRECEFAIFRSIEEFQELPAVERGFSTMEEFLACAQTVLQRRKSRSGRSLELHTRAIFAEEGFCEGRHFSHQQESEPGRRPDFLFPSVDAYRDSSFPGNRLRMLAVKTTCRDRWRQVLREADRIETKHLLTLQEGISEGQFREMRDAGVQLVVPGPSVHKFPVSVRSGLRTLGEFIADMRRVAMVGSLG